MMVVPDILKPSLSQKFKAVIWKIEVDEDQDIIAIETRDANTHSTAFSSFNYKTGECYFKEQSTENSWWWGLDRVHDGLIYLHGYKSESSPEHRGIIAWDAKTGKLAWQQFNYAFDNICTEGIIAHNALMQSSKPDLLSTATGELIIRNVQEYRIIGRKIRLPGIFNNPSLPDFIPENVVEPVLYMEYNGNICWGFHIKNAAGYTQKLIITKNDTVILSENLAEDIQKLNPEAFFMHKNNLFCIRAGNYEIVSYLL